MSEKQGWNGGYYGGRGGGPLGCCCSCIFGLVFMGLAFFVFCLIIKPNRVKFHVTDATLTQFNYSSDNNLHHKLALKANRVKFHVTDATLTQFNYSSDNNLHHKLEPNRVKFHVTDATHTYSSDNNLHYKLALKPNRVKFHVRDATHTQFNYSSDNNLHYNLALNLTIRNPNKKLGIYYDRIEARANYEGQRFSTITLTPFYQGHKTTNVLNPIFNGQQLLVGSNLQSEYQKQTSAGVYEIEMKLYLRIRFKFGRIKTGKFKPRVECDLKVPLSTNGNSATTFETKRCKIDYFN